MSDREHDELLQAWEQDIQDEFVAELSDASVGAIAASAASSAAAGAAGAGAGIAGAATASTATTFAIGTAAKVLIAVALAVTVGVGLAAVTGVLPDPIQEFVSDIGDSIGLDLPRPELPLPDPDLVPTLPLPDLPVDPDSVPDLGELTDDLVDPTTP